LAPQSTSTLALETHSLRVDHSTATSRANLESPWHLGLGVACCFGLATWHTRTRSTSRLCGVVAVRNWSSAPPAPASQSCGARWRVGARARIPLATIACARHMPARTAEGDAQRRAPTPPQVLRTPRAPSSTSTSETGLLLPAPFLACGGRDPTSKSSPSDSRQRKVLCTESSRGTTREC
jgi:hypothetical protein